MQAVICTLLLGGAAKLQDVTARWVSMQMWLQVKHWALWNQKKTKLPSSNNRKAAWPLCYLRSGRAVALVRFIFLFRKTRDVKYQIHLEGIRVPHEEKDPKTAILLCLLGKLASLWKNDRCFCRIYWERDEELHWKADSQKQFLPEWKIATEIWSYFIYTMLRNVCSSQWSNV